MDDIHDDYCVFCGMGGDLLCCEICPITCHYACTGLEKAPEGAWYCPGCTCCLCNKKMYASVKDLTSGIKPYRGAACFVGEAASSVVYNDVLDVSIYRKLFLKNQYQGDARGAVKEMGDRPSSVPELMEITLSNHKEHAYPEQGRFEHEQGSGDENQSCYEIKSVCGSRAHCSCLREFPQLLCDRMPWYNKLEAKTLTGITHICTQGAIKVGQYSCGSDVFIQIIHAASAAGQQAQGLAPYYTEKQKSSLRKILSACLAVLSDSYNDLWDSRTGANLIPMILQGQYIPPYVDFSGMYVAPLFINSTIVSVACFRLLGSEIVEVPLMATRREIRGCKAGKTLLNKLEDVLHQFGVTTFVTHATYCPLYPYLPAFHPQGEALPPPSQEKFGFSVASKETVGKVISHGGLRIPGVPWVEKNIGHVDWTSWMKVLEGTHLQLNTNLIDIDSRVKCGIISSVKMAEVAIKEEAGPNCEQNGLEEPMATEGTIHGDFNQTQEIELTGHHNNNPIQDPQKEDKMDPVAPHDPRDGLLEPQGTQGEELISLTDKLLGNFAQVEATNKYDYDNL